jgi:hypothetical protein
MKHIKYFLIFLGLLIVAVIAVNYINSKPKKAKENPYEYNVDEFKEVDPDLISHQEIRKIKINMGEHGGIAAANGNIYLAAGTLIKTLTPDGQLLGSFSIDEEPYCLAANEELLVVAYEKALAAYSFSGELLFHTGTINDSTFITSVAFFNNLLAVADAGKRRVYLFDKEKKVAEIEGISGAKNLHGFIIPSAKFDLAVNPNGDLWVVNPGMHALQHYDEKGNLLEAWDRASLQIDGFSGCCNPAHFTFLPDGRFVTSEKGMPRIKIYRDGGVLESVVAPPSKFVNNGRACDVATLGETIIALDYDQKMIRIFVPTASPHTSQGGAE